MKAILLKDIPNLGKRGEVKEVKMGYFKNFLLAKSLAKPFNFKTQKELEVEQKLIDIKVQKEVEKANQIKEKLENLALKFYLKTGEKEQTFGSITPSKIIEELKNNGIELIKENIELKDHIKTLGFQEIKINLGHGLESLLKIQVLPKN